MSDYSQAQRQIMIFMILGENSTGMDIRSIHNILSAWGYNVTERTIRRDIQSLSRTFPIYENPTRPISFVLKKMNINNIDMSFDDLQAIRLVQELIRPYQHLDVGINAEKLLQNFFESLSADQKKWLKHASPLLQVNLNELVNEQEYNPEIKKIVEQSILTKQCMKIKYYSFHNDTISLRTVEPHFLEINGGSFHLWAFCHQRSAMRDFRISRILSAETTSERFTRKEELLKKSLDNRFESMSGEEAILIKLRFSATSARVVKEYHGKRADKLEECNDGTVLFERNAAITPEIKQWILGFGSEVEVLEPADLRETIRKAAIKMLYVYEK